MINVVNGGFYTTIQDYPGRVGYWNVGIPPSGPMDSLAFRIANRLVGNSDQEAGLEITVVGPKLEFLSDAVISLTGAKIHAEINGQEVPWWEAFYVRKGSVLNTGALQGDGCRSYLAVEGGINVPEYLGSKSTFPKGGFGGYEGRPLKKGDNLHTNKNPVALNYKHKLDARYIPPYSKEWEVNTLLGPHADPDYFTTETVDMFYATSWRVHRNSNRLGYRLEGPKPQFSRKDGGEGGRHPSNLHDYAYAIGTVNFTGDMPIILTVDGPSLGGFVSMATIVTADLWKIGQAKLHDHIRFKKISVKKAIEEWEKQEIILNEISNSIR